MSSCTASALMRVADDPVLLAVQDGVALVTLNRPDAQNAWNPALGARYAAILESCATDTAVRAIVVTGAGGHFCPGGDPAVLAGIASAGSHATVAAQRPPWIALSIAKPVIAAISGVCFGVGLLQALYCDIRIAAADAKFSTAYARRGLPAEMGMSWLLPRAIGTARAADLLFSARVVRAEEAERIGLVNRVVPAATLLDEAMGYARMLATHCAPLGLRAAKLQLYADLMADFSTAFDRSEAMAKAAYGSADFAEGVASWREKRAPAFPPLAAELGRLELKPWPASDDLQAPSSTRC